jgi:predicted metalloprotease
MLKIFAKLGTDEKVLIVCLKQQAEVLQLLLAAKHGGEWILVDKLNRV